MRSWIFCGVVAGILTSTTAGAQSLEETYANLCSDEATAKSEACTALRQALIAKLQGQNKGAKTAAKAEIKPQASLAAAGARTEGPTAVPPPAGPDAATLASWRKRWGFFVDMVDKTWNSATSPGYLTTYRWKVPGEVLEFTTRSPDGKTVITQSQQWDEALHSLVSRSGDLETYSAVQPDGSIESTGKPGTLTANYRGVIRQRADGAIENESYEMKDGAWSLFSRDLAAVYLPGAEPPKLEGPLAPLQQQIVDMRKRDEEAEATRQRELLAAQRPATPKAKRGSVLGTLLIAGVGATAASQFGGDTEQIIGGALKGAQIANADNALGSALAAPADTMLAGATSASGGGAAGGPGGAAPASYPTQPNLAAGSCAGFTEANYREKAVSGGGDQQLYTMCGQAFEYYTMYKRAIAQGYSQADAERTYSAHREAAATASRFLSTHGAN